MAPKKKHTLRSSRKVPGIFYGSKKNSIFSKVFHISCHFKIARNSVQREPSSYTRVQGETDRHDEVNSRFLRPHAEAPQRSNKINRTADMKKFEL
jgi:hypothetical protein